MPLSEEVKAQIERNRQAALAKQANKRQRAQLTLSQNSTSQFTPSNPASPSTKTPPPKTPRISPREAKISQMPPSQDLPGALRD